MTETLTESFCERCGTRYEFTAPTRLNPLRKTAGFIGGLKNWVTSQDDMSDAMRDAMRQQEESLAAAQLEAFHESFNFCIDCRQYTCLNCWNDDAGRCRSCAPVPGTDDLAERLTAAMAADNGLAATGAAVAEPVLAEDDHGRGPGMDAWPTSDLPVHSHRSDVAWPDADVSTPTPSTSSADIAPEPEPEPVPEPMVASEPEPMVAEAVPEPMVAEAEPEPMVAEAEPEPMVAEAQPVAAVDPLGEPDAPLLRVVAWEEDEVAAEAEMEPEPTLAEAEPEPMVADTEPVAAEPVAEAEPVMADAEPVMAEAEPVAEAEPDPAPEPARRIAPISETILRFPDRSETAAPAPDRQAAEDESPEVAARRAQLDLLGLGDVGHGPVEPDRPSVVPYRSRGAAPTPTELAMRAGHTGGFWEASAREVAGAAAAIGVQNCGACGLSLSANARFCRRCGTRQARSA